jgi:hypothetical protein
MISRQIRSKEFCKLRQFWIGDIDIRLQVSKKGVIAGRNQVYGMRC